MKFLFGRKRRNRAWAICRVDRRVGLIPLDVLQRSTTIESENVQRLLQDGDFPLHHAVGGYGRIIRPSGSEVIVVKDDKTPEFFALTANVFLVQQQFFVPTQETTFTVAYERIHGRLYAPPDQEYGQKLADLYKKHKSHYGRETMNLVYALGERMRTSHS